MQDSLIACLPVCLQVDMLQADNARLQHSLQEAQQLSASADAEQADTSTLAAQLAELREVLAGMQSQLQAESDRAQAESERAQAECERAEVAERQAGSLREKRDELAVQLRAVQEGCSHATIQADQVSGARVAP